MLRSYPATYGKTQSKYPAQRLTADEYRNLTNACGDDDRGMRDALLIRLAVAGGMRAAEIIGLQVSAARRGRELIWYGKARKQRTAKIGVQLRGELDRYLARYEEALGRPLTDSDPLFCVLKHYPHGEMNWGVGIRHTETLRTLIRRAAANADLPRMAPHDLKRTAARMMHESKSADGGHIFDLLEIASVLDHANPKITKDCYIGPLGNASKDRAADLFD